MNDALLADNFADNLRAAISRKRISQRELARMSGVHFVTINRILSREMDPSLKICKRLADALDMSPERIFRFPSKTA